MLREDKDPRIHWIAINLIGGIDPRAAMALSDYFGGAKAAWEAGKKEIENCPAVSPAAKKHLIEGARNGLEAAEKEISGAREAGIDIVTVDCAGYPERLRNLDARPPVLYIKGKAETGAGLSIAIVGTRKCTSYGKDMAFELGRDLSRAGVTVISGLAHGIDTYAHKGALDGGGRTIAVLGSGLNCVYPAINLKLSEDIAAAGALMSEFPLNAGPEKWTFPRRNRIISGLSYGVVVIEAPEGSGALITVTNALEQGREVFAVPGNVKSRLSKGGHKLLREGACLVESAEDILSEFQLRHEQVELSFAPRLEGREGQFFELISGEPLDFDELCRRAQCPASEAASALTMMEMKGLVRQLPGRLFVRQS